MSNLSYLWIFLTSAALAVSLTPLARGIAIRHDILDRPTGHKSHTSPTPYLGGAALVLGVLGAAGLYTIVRPPASELGELVVVLGLALAIAALGFIDDIRSLGAVSRLFVETAAAVGIWAADVRIDVFSSDGMNFIATLLWIVGLTNAQNFLDNMDGLAAAVAAVAGGWILAIAALNGQFLVASLAAGVTGCAVGFLFHNVHPARIYMGDGGSLFLGFLLAYLAIKLRFQVPTRSAFLVPILVLGVPIFDATFVVLDRLRHGKNPMIGGNDHTSHRLVRLGLRTPTAVALIAAAGVVLGGVALLVSRVGVLSAWVLAGVIALLFCGFGIRLSMVATYDAARGMNPEARLEA